MVRKKIYRADYTFRAIPLRAGTHRVEFLYDPLSFKLGGGITLLGIIGCLVIGLLFEVGRDPLNRRDWRREIWSWNFQWSSLSIMRLEPSEMIRRVKEAPFEKEIIVVDDGSTDGTGASSRQQGDGITVLFHESNQGKGAAIRTAIPHISWGYCYHSGCWPGVSSIWICPFDCPYSGGNGRCCLWLPIPWRTTSGPFLLACRRKQDNYHIIQYADRLKPFGYGDRI